MVENTVRQSAFVLRQLVRTVSHPNPVGSCVKQAGAHGRAPSPVSPKFQVPANRRCSQTSHPPGACGEAHACSGRGQARAAPDLNGAHPQGAGPSLLKALHEAHLA